MSDGGIYVRVTVVHLYTFLVFVRAHLYPTGSLKRNKPNPCSHRALNTLLYGIRRICTFWNSYEKEISIYINGEKSEKDGNRHYAIGSNNGIEIGHGTASSRFWMGYVDELQLYPRVLSPDQIYQIYKSQKDGTTDISVIVADHTSLGDIWQCYITPNDRTQDGETIISNLLQIVYYNGG